MTTQRLCGSEEEEHDVNQIIINLLSNQKQYVAVRLKAADVSPAGHIRSSYLEQESKKPFVSLRPNQQYLCFPFIFTD